MKKNRRFLWILFSIAFVLTLYIISDTLALFENNSEAKANIDVAKWTIKINNQDITKGVNHKITLNDFIYNQNNHTKENYIAPGTSAYQDIIIDASECDVAIRYDISFDLENTDYSENIVLSTSIVDGSSSTQTGENTYSGVISLNQINNNDLIKLRITINWLNETNYDEEDTKLGIVDNNHISIPISVSLSQYLGESI